VGRLLRSEYETVLTARPVAPTLARFASDGHATKFLRLSPGRAGASREKVGDDQDLRRKEGLADVGWRPILVTLHNEHSRRCLEGACPRWHFGIARWLIRFQPRSPLSRIVQIACPALATKPTMYFCVAGTLDQLPTPRPMTPALTDFVTVSEFGARQWAPGPRSTDSAKTRARHNCAEGIFVT
jgi:hypothetical protein